MSLLIEHPPSNEPVTAAEVRAHLRLDTTTDDALLGTLITSAREFAEKITRRSLVYKGYAQYRDCFPWVGEPMSIPAPPLIAVDSVLYLDTLLNQQTWDPSEYIVASKQSPALIVPKPNNLYPVAARVPSAVEIHFHAGYYSDGYGDSTRPIPEHLRLAIMQLAGHWYEHPEMSGPDAQVAVPNNLMALLRSNTVYVF